MADLPSSEGGLIRATTPGGLAERVGLRPGDRLLAVDGRPLRDVIDFQFHAVEESFRLTISRDGEVIEIAVAKRPREELGVEFAEAVFDGVRTCNNDCLFCFLKGLPPGLRPSLYLKDDDYRLSFCHGNFVTLSNLTARDWQRLAEQRLSPLNVSVHATDPDVRRRLLDNPRAPAILDQLRRLAALQIRVNAQVVLCPGLNDGDHLVRTVHELAELYPTVQSIGIVPAGVTRHAEETLTATVRQHLPACTPAYARQLIRAVRPWQRAFRRRWGVDLVYPADEYYLLAGGRLPAAAHYDGYPQYENGIGMSRSLIDDWRKTRRRLRSQGRADYRTQRVALLSGTLIAPILQGMARELAALTGIDVAVVPVESRFWGPRVTVSGLLTAGDIVAALREAPPADLIALPRASLDYAGLRFLDDGTPAEVEAAAGTPILFAHNLSEVLRHLSSPLK
jgi:putative radical SAM enzyme (TIGR03279 family)